MLTRLQRSRVLKWFVGLATLMTLALWIGSYRWYVNGSFGGVACLDLYKGDVDVRYGPRGRSPFADRWSIGPVNPDYRDAPGFDLSSVLGNGYSREIKLHLWIPVASFLFLAAVLWGSRLFSRGNKHIENCSACGYSREGLAANSVCPECGRWAGKSAQVVRHNVS